MPIGKFEIFKTSIDGSDLFLKYKIDSANQESEGVNALRRPLMVAFEGEQAMDANPLSEAGVRREFFMLLLQAIGK